MTLIVRNLGLQAYEPVWQRMRQLTQERTSAAHDEIWIVEHTPVYTLGMNGKREHLLDTGAIPIVQTDRGGQATYHGPGQLVIYTLLDLKRHQLGIRQLVSTLETAMTGSLAQYGVKAFGDAKRPGVYVDDRKIGSIGLRVKNQCSYHGLSLNNRMDLKPFDGINTCGYPGLEVTQLADFGVDIDIYELAVPVVHAIEQALTL
ncbi:MAG: lipoyl(octanoyl) transferase LipB [Methylomicrobium sp.]